MSKFTPGPWYADEQSYISASFYIRGSDGDGKRLTWGKGAVAHIPRSAVMPSEANAKLIAAAPDLLAALQNIRTSVRDGHNESEAWGWVDAAIAKATGEPT